MADRKRGYGGGAHRETRRFLLDRYPIEGGEITRYFLPNYFNRFWEQLKRDSSYSILIGNRGQVLELLDAMMRLDYILMKRMSFCHDFSKVILHEAQYLSNLLLSKKKILLHIAKLNQMYA